jgi:hypothetical protein
MDIALIKLEKEFLNTNFVQYQDDFEGQKVLNDGTIVIGNKAGPSSYNTISNTCHEMSHLVEIDDARMRCYGWGLKYPEVWVYDRMCIEPTTHQITDRELRVMAYQCNLLDYIGVKHTVKDITSSLEYLSDTAFVPIEDGGAPYSENKNHNLDYTQIKKSQQRWRVNQVNRLRNEFTIERFISEWNRKIEWMNNNEYVPLTFE